MTTVSPRSCDPHPPRGAHLALGLSFVLPSSLAMSPKASSTTFESCWRSGSPPSRHAYPSECTRVRLGWSVGGAVQKDSHPRCIQTTPSERPARRDSTALGTPVIWCSARLIRGGASAAVCRSTVLYPIHHGRYIFGVALLHTVSRAAIPLPFLPFGHSSALKRGEAIHR
jgi:hypothetical protein